MHFPAEWHLLLPPLALPLVVRVYRAVRASSALADVIIATDSDEIFNVCREHSCNAHMTSPRHRSGTERVQEISQSVAGDVYLNVQGDEPMVRAEQINTIVELMNKRKYDGQALAAEIICFLQNQGYEIYDLCPVYREQSGWTTEFDAVFIRNMA